MSDFLVSIYAQVAELSLRNVIVFPLKLCAHSSKDTVIANISNMAIFGVKLFQKSVVSFHFP